VAHVLGDGVPRDHRGPAVVGRRARERGLLEHERGSSVAAHPVQHPDERGGDERDRVLAHRERGRPDRRRERQHHEEAPPADPVAQDRRDRGRERRPDQARGDHGAQRDRVHPAPGQPATEQHPDEARRDGARERGRVQHRAVHQSSTYRIIPSSPFTHRPHL
jgi:hypothetical protein